MATKISDLFNDYGDSLTVAKQIFHNYGGVTDFSGPVVTIKVEDDHTLLRSMLEQGGAGRVLVVDGGGAMDHALLDDELAALAHDNGWSGVVVHGCVRDTPAIGRIELGVKALGSNPRRSETHGEGQRGITLSFAGIPFHTGQWLYADADGLAVSEEELV